MICTALPVAALSATGPDTLAGIGRATAALAIWDRALPADLAAALSALDLTAVDDVAMDFGCGDPLDAALRNAGYPEDLATALSADIVALAGRHALLTGEDRLSIRLDVIETDACRRFHADYVTLRLLCTYCGPGTEWHPVDAPDAIERVPTGAVAVFKGRLLLDPPTVLHRSPPIAGTGQRRLMLVIDPARPADR